MKINIYKYLKYLIIIIVIIIFFCVYKFIYVEDVAVPKLTLNGNKLTIIEVNKEYKEQGARAVSNNKDISNSIITTGSVDTSRVGEYKITYTAQNSKKKNKRTIERIVKVVDKIKPIISLIGKYSISIYVNQIYQEQGAKATDNYDGDITSSIKINNKIDNTKIGKYEVIYSVKDSSSNESSVTRSVEVVNVPISMRKKGLPILMYHFFYDPSIGQIAHDNNWLKISAFEKHVKYLKDNNYYYPTWAEVKNYVEGKIRLPSNSIVITVDDGNNSFFNLAVPILLKYDVPATSFIVTSWINPHLINVNRSLITFMSHSHDMHHGGCTGGSGGLFRCLNYTKAYNDVITSKNIVYNGDVFCYPFGDYTDQSLRVLKDANYSLAVTTRYGKVYPNINPLLLPRIRITNNTSFDSFVNNVK